MDRYSIHKNLMPSRVLIKDPEGNWVKYEDYHEANFRAGYYCDMCGIFKKAITKLKSENIRLKEALKVAHESYCDKHQLYIECYAESVEICRDEMIEEWINIAKNNLKDGGKNKCQ